MSTIEVPMSEIERHWVYLKPLEDGLMEYGRLFEGRPLGADREPVGVADNLTAGLKAKELGAQIKREHPDMWPTDAWHSV